MKLPASRRLTTVPAWYSSYTVVFKYDATKGTADDPKRGIDLDPGQTLWDDVDLIEIPARGTDEPRFIII